MKLLVIDREKLVVWRTDTFAAADHMLGEDNIGPEGIEYCIEEYGRCDTQYFTVIPEEWEEAK